MLTRSRKKQSLNMGNICPGGISSGKSDRVGLQTQAEELVNPRSPNKTQTIPEDVSSGVPAGENITSDKSIGGNSPGTTPAGENSPGATPTGENIPGTTPTGGNIPGTTPTGENIPGTTPTGGNIPDATPTGGNIPDATPTGGNIPGATPTGEDRPGASPTPPKSRHSPPVSRVHSSTLCPHPSLEGLGSISSVWSRPEKWAEFRVYLMSLSEGEDSEGRPMNLDRYAVFLEMFAKLDHAQQKLLRPQTELKQLVLDIADSEEEFFGRERGLMVVDGGMRKVVRGRIKAVRNEEEQAGVEVYKEVYPRVLDKLNELLGVYQNVTLNKSK